MKEEEEEVKEAERLGENVLSVASEVFSDIAAGDVLGLSLGSSDSWSFDDGIIDHAEHATHTTQRGTRPRVPPAKSLTLSTHVATRG